MQARLEERVRAGIEPLVRPGEELQEIGYALRSPFPAWVRYLFEGALLMLLMTPYYIGLTNERLIFAKVSRLSGKRSALDFDVARAQAKVVKFRKGFLWSQLMLKLPDRRMRLRFAMQRAEAERIAQALGS